jgi:hypothetical protein
LYASSKGICNITYAATFQRTSVAKYENGLFSG